MPLFSATNLCYAIGTRTILAGASFSIEPGERVGLVGRNGCGKTTLMRVMMGRVKPDTGMVTLQRGARVGYLSQDPELNPEHTLREEAAMGLIELRRLHAELDEVYHKMALPEFGSPDQLQELMDQQADLQHRIEAWGSMGDASGGGYATDHRVDAILHGLGFVDGQFSVLVKNLSGGQKGRLSLAKLLLESPDLLLLDEPTNHLDIAGREWLEQFLVEEFAGAVLMVSHDRYMLDRVVTRIEEVEGGRLIEYPGNYSTFTELRKQRLITMHRAYENQQSQWAKEEEYIRRFRAGQRAKEAQGRLSKLERQKEEFALERPMEMDSVRFRFPEAPRSGDQAVIVREASKMYENAQDDDPTPHRKVLFNGLNVTISRGERWGVIGPNGAGKTTLVRALLDLLPLDSGSARLGANVFVGYYAQLPPDVDDELPVFQYLQRVIRKENPAMIVSEQGARDLAGVFLFSGEDQNKPLAVLSGGERSRARLAGLLASAKNLLILDEPTNHLDIPSAERLEAALKPTEVGAGYTGTLILISHDRALIDGTCDHLLVMDGKGGVVVFHGNYSEWHRKQMEAKGSATSGAKDQSGRAEAAGGPPKPAAVGWGGGAVAHNKASSRAGSGRGGTAKAASNGAVAPKKGGGGRGGGVGGGGKGERSGLSWMAVDRLEKEIERLTRDLKKAEEKMGSEEVFRDAAKCRQTLTERDELAAALERHEAEWLRRSTA